MSHVIVRELRTLSDISVPRMHTGITYTTRHQCPTHAYGNNVHYQTSVSHACVRELRTLPDISAPRMPTGITYTTRHQCPTHAYGNYVHYQTSVSHACLRELRNCMPDISVHACIYGKDRAPSETLWNNSTL